MQKSTDPNASSVSEPVFSFGPYVPIIRPENNVIIDPRGIVSYYSENNPDALKNRSLSELLPDDSIVEAPSLVTPLLLKKKTIWPPKDHSKEEDAPNSGQDTDNGDDVEIVKVVGKPQRDNLDNSKCVEDYVRLTAVASLTSSKTTSASSGSILTIEDYFKSSVGEFLYGIGLSRATEFNLENHSKRLATKIKRSDGDCASLVQELEASRSLLTKSATSNKPFKPTRYLYCHKCPFKTEFETVLEGHLEIPHIQRKDYICNWCEYKVKDPNQIIFHTLFQHKKHCRLERPLLIHNCRYCPYESRSKRKFEPHIAKCEQTYQPATYLSPQSLGELDFSCITSKFITQEDIKTYEQTLKALRLSAYSPHQVKVPGPPGSGGSSILIINNPNNRPTSNPVIANRPTNNKAADIRSLGPPNAIISVNDLLKNRQQLLNNQAAQNNQASSQLLNLLAAHNFNIGPTKSSLALHPRVQSSFVNGRTVINSASHLIMTSQHQNKSSSSSSTNRVDNLSNSQDALNSGGRSLLQGSSSNQKGVTFVICEICDGYIKDLNQLRSHMQWTHKVRIHQKMLESRPPLSCQKCQWRFFTDQGLERHLLGSHGLVTSNMQELVDRDADSGRCTICGKTYPNKLVAHMKEVHKSNLKPAHLSYKCTVCAATFNLYRLFENHVYSVHRDSVRRLTSN